MGRIIPYIVLIYIYIYIVENKSHVWNQQPDMVDLWLAHEALQCQPSLLRSSETHEAACTNVYPNLFLFQKGGKKAAKNDVAMTVPPVWTNFFGL